MSSDIIVDEPIEEGPTPKEKAWLDKVDKIKAGMQEQEFDDQDDNPDPGDLDGVVEVDTDWTTEQDEEDI